VQQHAPLHVIVDPSLATAEVYEVDGLTNSGRDDGHRAPVFPRKLTRFPPGRKPWLNVKKSLSEAPSMTALS
jgi:hypothetical protein